MSINLSKTLYSDCIEMHPITFNWATIVVENSDDDVSIFENVKKYFLPEFVEDELKTSPMYKKLFDLIDTNNNSQIEAQELEEATKNKTIKKITSKYIVKHSSEWHIKTNMPKSTQELLESYKDSIKNYDKIKKHLKNEEKELLTMLSLNSVVV